MLGFFYLEMKEAGKISDTEKPYELPNGNIITIEECPLPSGALPAKLH